MFCALPGYEANPFPFSKLFPSSLLPPSPSLVVPPVLADEVTVVVLSIFKHILQQTQHQVIPGNHGNKGEPLAL